MKITILNSKLLRRTEEGYREYCMELKEWSEFFDGQEYFPVIIADESVDFTEEKYKRTYQYLQENRESILDVLAEYSLKEYDYNREFCFLDSGKRNFEHVARYNPKIEGRENAKGFFQLKKIYIIPVEKEGYYYTVFDIKVLVAKLEGRDYMNYSFSLILQKNSYVVACDSYGVWFLQRVATEDKNREVMSYTTSGHGGLNFRTGAMDLTMDDIDYSQLRFRGRSMMGKYKELFPYVSCMGLYESSDRNCDCGLPTGSKIIGRIGVDGIFFFIVKRLGRKKEEAPIYVVSPMNFDCYIAPVARNLLEFISLGVAFGNFGVLENVSSFDKDEVEQVLPKEGQDLNLKKMIAEIEEHFPLIPIAEPYEYVKMIQEDEVLSMEAKKLECYILKKLGLGEECNL